MNYHRLAPVLIFGLLVGAACAQDQPVLAVGLRETAKHRAAHPAVRCAKCVERSHAETYLWVDVDPQGRVISVHGIDGTEVDPAIQNAVRMMRYTPFTREGIPVRARVQDAVMVLPAELKPSRMMPFPEVSNPADVSIKLCRSGCFGACPSYTVEILGDGSVLYNGNGSVSIAGAHSADVEVGKVLSLLDRFRAANFFSLRNSYRAGVTDNPTYQLSLRIGRRTKVVEDYVGEWVGMPVAVTELEAAVDTTADSARWVSSSPRSVEALRQAGIALRSPQAEALLWAAVDSGDVITVRSLLDAGTPISSRPSSPKWSPFSRFSSDSLLELAVEARNEGARSTILKTLLGSPVIQADGTAKQHALARAVESGEVDLARILIDSGANPAERFTGRYQQQGWTYLMLAAASGAWAMIEDALARPHDINAVDASGHTALVVMVRNAPQIEDIFPLLDRLMRAGAQRSELDRILLETCHPNWIPGLVARGGNINARDAKGNTPLFQTCTVEGVQALLDAGADPTLRNFEGKTAAEATYPPDEGKEDSRAAVIRRFLTRPVR